MQTIILNEQESEQIRPAMGAGGHVTNLFLGLLIGLLLIFFDRRQSSEWQPDQYEVHSSWQRTLLTFIGAFFLLLIIVWLIGR